MRVKLEGTQAQISKQFLSTDSSENEKERKKWKDSR